MQLLSKNKIVCIGDSGIDSYINLGKEVLGGIAFNFALNAKENGLKVSLLSCIGSEDEEQIIDKLRENNINYSKVQVKEGKSAIQEIYLHSNAKREFVGYIPGALSSMKITPEDIKFIQEHDALTCPLSDSIEQVFFDVMNIPFEGLKVADISIDFENYSDDLIKKYAHGFDIIFIGGSEKIIHVVKEVASSNPNKIFVLTLGKKGSIAFKDKKAYFQTALPAKIFDTTGCGDAFQAGFVAEYLKSKNISQSLKKGSQQASKIICILGGSK